MQEILSTLDAFTDLSLDVPASANEQKPTPTMEPFKTSLPPLVKLLDYEQIFTHDYPVYVDDRSREERILNECQYHIGRFMAMDGEYFNCDTYLFEVPVTELFKFLDKETDSIREMRAVLIKNGYKINKKDQLELEPDDSSSSSSSSSDDINVNEQNEGVVVEAATYVADHEMKDEEDWSQ